MSISLNKKYKTINNESVKVVGASVLNYSNSGLINKNDPTVILVHCEKDNGEYSYWLDWQLKEISRYTNLADEGVWSPFDVETLLDPQEN